MSFSLNSRKLMPTNINNKTTEVNQDGCSSIEAGVRVLFSKMNCKLSQVALY